jgi:DNA-binding MarR family transcriptional regulator
MTTTKSQDNNFIHLDFELLKDTTLSLTQKFFISYLKSHQRQGRYCFEKQTELAIIFGLPLRSFKRLVKELLKLDLIFFKRQSEVIGGGRQYKNRKAIILVDDNNPLPKKEEEVIKLKDIQGVEAPIVKMVKETYHGALFYASSKINFNEKYYITVGEFKVLLKLIHYASTYEDITFQNKDIAKHLYMSEITIKDICESLRRKGYITSKCEIFNKRLGFADKRTIYINWNFIQTIFDMSQKEIITESFNF